jgi:hypothetical protein
VKRVLLGAGLAIGMLVTAGAALVLLNLVYFWEPEVPSSDELPDLPDGLRVVHETEGCGSGSCYRQFEIVGGSTDTPEDILAQLPSDEECTRHSLVDWRPLCVGYRSGPDRAMGYISLGKWQGG